MSSPSRRFCVRTHTSALFSSLQITTRVQVRRSLDNAEFYGPAIGLGYSSAVTAGIIKSISEENTLDSEAVVALFATELKERTVRSIRGDSGAGAAGSGGSGAGSGVGPPSSPSVGSAKIGDLRRDNSTSTATLPTLVEEDDGVANNPLHTQPAAAAPAASGSGGESVTSGSSKNGATAAPAMPTFTSPFTNAIINSNPALSRTVTNTSENTTSEMSFHTAESLPTPGGSTTQPSTAAAAAAAVVPDTPRLLSLSEGMPEYYVQSAIQTLIFDTNTSEGNTRKIFIDKFKAACIVSMAQNALRDASARGHMQAGAGGGKFRYELFFSFG